MIPKSFRALSVGLVLAWGISFLGARPWAVEEAHGPSKTVRFATDEGTWLSLDVHPDGERIVFSLLGDLYLLPIEGGVAQRLTKGSAYDVQPRWSPDGTRIAFASDRSGMENLWIIDADGRNAQQISHETVSTVNSPAWSPDGVYLLGRKRITDTSSLATVELFLWHLQGGEGMRVTESDAQPDAADPVFAEDGRYIYYAARDARFRYNRDVYEGIWQIKRLDLITGQNLPLLKEVGGSSAPMLSPDGGALAFIRREDAQTVLEVLDLETKRIRRLASGLQRDNQEGFAFHGTFPGYAWTPDGSAILASAEGKIWRWNIADGTRIAVPFTARVEQTVTEALRFEVPLGGESVQAKVIRWPVESPDGRWLVFAAMGHLYAMALPDGEPYRLTELADFEFSPAFSRSGDRLAFVTWNDSTGGHIWTAKWEQGALTALKRVSSTPGHYVNPAFSPDGTKLVFLEGGGTAVRGGDLGDEIWHEISWMSADGGERHAIIGTSNRGTNRRMARPTFSADGERIFYLEDEAAQKPFSPPKSVLISVQLDGTDRRTHLRWQKAEEAVVSPDGKWVAYHEAHDAYLTAMPPLESRTVDVSTEGAAVPVVRLSREGGEWLNWASRGEFVTWSFAAAYHRVSLADAMARPEGDKASEQSGEDQALPQQLPAAQTLTIDLQLPRARPSEQVVYQGARVITMRGDEVIERGMIVVDQDRIVAVGAMGEYAVPMDARVVDLHGRTVIPGLFDMHAHLHYSALDILPTRPWKYLANLAYGITSTHDPSAATQEVFSQAEMVEAGLIIGPRIFSTGFILYGADLPGRAKIESLEDARRHVRRLKALGAFTVKSYMQPRREQRQWLIAAAREEGMMVVPEGGGDLEMDMTMILDGHTTIEHSLPIAPLYNDVLRLMAASETAYVPTLLVAYGGLSGDLWFHQHEEVWRDEKLRRYVPASVLEPLTRIRSVMAPEEDWRHFVEVAESAKRLMDAGGRVCLGGHGQMQGLGPHWEIRTFVRGGMTPLEALRVATLFPAETLGLDGDLGSIEEGKLADFVVLEANPLEKIENSTSVVLVVKNGRAYALDELERVRGAADPTN